MYIFSGLAVCISVRRVTALSLGGTGAPSSFFDLEAALPGENERGRGF
jgi:hypothetical protein